MKIKEELAKLEGYYAAIGETFIREQNRNLPPEYQQVYSRLAEAKKRISELQRLPQAAPAGAPAGQRQCPSCHAPLEPDAVFCNSCGASLAENQAQQSQNQQAAFSSTAGQGQQIQANVPPSQAPGGMCSAAAQNYGGQFAYLTEEQLPEQFRPLGAWAYFGWTILFNLPFVGWIITLIKALGKTGNINLRNFARSMFCVYAVILILYLIILGTSGCVASSLYY